MIYSLYQFYRCHCELMTHGLYRWVRIPGLEMLIVTIKSSGGRAHSHNNLYPHHGILQLNLHFEVRRVFTTEPPFEGDSGENAQNASADPNGQTEFNLTNVNDVGGSGANTPGPQTGLVDLDSDDRDSNEQPITRHTSDSNSFIPLHADSMLIHMSNSIDEVAVNAFKNYITNRDRFVIPDNKLSHFKNKSNAKILDDSHELFVKYQSRESLMNLFFGSFRKLIFAGSPVDSTFLKEIESAALAKPTNRDFPFMSLSSLRGNPIGEAIYGISMGLPDLIYFMPSFWKSVEINLMFNADLNEKGKPFNTIVDFGSYDNKVTKRVECSSPLRSFPSLSSTDMDRPLGKFSIFNLKSALSIISVLYDIHMKCDYKVINSKPSERFGLISRDGKDHISYSDGFKITDTVIQDLDFTHYSEDLIRSLMALFLLKWNGKDVVSRGGSTDETFHILNYLGSLIHQYIQSSVKSIAGNVEIVYIDCKVEIKRRTNERDPKALIKLFKGAIDEGHAVPVSPIHYISYLNESFDVSEWEYLIFISALAGFNPNYDIFKTLAPKISTESRRDFVEISKNRSRLESKFYESDVVLPFQHSRTFGISYNDFLFEMLVRSLLNGPTPDYFLTFSEGRWVGSTGSSLTIVPGHINPLFHKFGLNDHHHFITDFIKKVMLDKGGDHKQFIPPYYVRSQTRLTESLPGVFTHFVPVNYHTSGPSLEIQDKYDFEKVSKE